MRLSRFGTRPAPGRARLVAGSLIAAVSVAGCGPSSPIDLQLMAAPEAVRARIALPACGVELVGRGEPYNLVARRCFWDAYTAGEKAEFITTRPSGGGQPLIVIFRSLGGGKIEFFVDESAIQGRPAWTRSTCEGLTATVDPSVEIDWIPGNLERPCDQASLLE